MTKLTPEKLSEETCRMILQDLMDTIDDHYSEVGKPHAIEVNEWWHDVIEKGGRVMERDDIKRTHDLAGAENAPEGIKEEIDYMSEIDLVILGVDVDMKERNVPVII